MNSKLTLLFVFLPVALRAQADFCIVSHMRSDDSVVRTNQDSMPWASQTLQDVLPHIDGITYSAYNGKATCARFLVADYHKPTESGNALFLQIKAGEQIKQAQNPIADLEIPLGSGSRLAKDQKIESAAWGEIVEGPIRTRLADNELKIRQKLLEELPFEGNIQAYCTEVSPSSGGIQQPIPNCVVLPLAWEQRRGLAASLFRIDAFPKDAFQQVHLIAEAASRCIKYWEVQEQVQPFDAIPVILQNKLVGEQRQSLTGAGDIALPWIQATIHVYQYVRLNGGLCGPLPQVPARRVPPPPGTQ